MDTIESLLPYARHIVKGPSVRRSLPAGYGIKPGERVLLAVDSFQDRLVVDLHGHFVSSTILQAYLKTPGGLRQQHLYSSPGFYSPADQIQVMDSAGLDIAVIIYPPMILEGIRAAGMSTIDGVRFVNDELSKLVKEHPDRFVGTAVVDPFSGTVALEEVDRAVTQLGMKGVSMLTNYDGLYADAEEFFPVYRLAEELHVPVFLHPVPTQPFWRERPGDGPGLNGLSMLFDTTLCIARMAWNRVFDRFPRLDFIFGQLGGAVPFFLGRFHLLREQQQMALKMSGNAGLAPIPEVRDYAGRFYVDAHSMDSLAIECAVEVFGADRIGLGGDYPITPPELGIPYCRQELAKARIPDEDKERILGANACSLFGIA